MSGALEGIKVIDFTQIQMGPSCTQQLGDFGADVIKIERIGTGEMWRRFPAFYWKGEHIPMLGLNRNKRCIALDLRSEAAKEIVYKLVEGADVVAHNFRPGAMDRMGFGYSTLSKINRRIIMANGSGFGETGPLAQLPSMDYVGVAMSGMMYRVTGDLTRPVRSAAVLGDFTAGQYMTQGILLALLARERSGVGQEVNVNLLDSVLGMMPQEAACILTAGDKEMFGARRVRNPLVALYRAKDEAYIMLVGTFAPQPVRDVCAAMGLPDYSQDPRFSSIPKVIENAEAMRAILEAKFLEKTRKEWLEIFEAHDITAGPALTLEEALEHPQVRHNDMVWEMDYKPLGKVRVLGQPIHLTGTPATVRKPPPLLGEHGDEILAELGYSNERIAQLKADKIVG